MQNEMLIVIVVIAGAVLVMWLLKRLVQVSAGEAKQLLKSGARVIDVRSRAEFNAGRVKGAVNVPLDELPARIGSVAPDKQAPLLLHCLSGTRSAMARSSLRRLGYARVYNLGSLGRARRIVES